jgi:hypothetical protein
VWYATQTTVNDVYQFYVKPANSYIQISDFVNPSIPTNPITNVNKNIFKKTSNYRLGGTVDLNITTPVTSNTAGATTSVYLRLKNGTPSNFRYTITQGGYAYTYNDEPASVLASITTHTFITNIVSSLETSTITLTKDLTTFHNNNYQYAPQGVPGNKEPSTLYDKYGDIVDVFNIEIGDYVILTTNNGSTYQFEISGVESTSSGLIISVRGQIPVVVVDALNAPTAGYAVKEFILLKRYKDEQNVILQFPKKPGATSYGFLIPNNINPTVIQDINSLQATVQTQLLSTQANTGG